MTSSYVHFRSSDTVCSHEGLSNEVQKEPVFYYRRAGHDVGQAHNICRSLLNTFVLFGCLQHRKVFGYF